MLIGSLKISISLSKYLPVLLHTNFRKNVVVLATFFKITGQVGEMTCPLVCPVNLNDESISIEYGAKGFKTFHKMNELKSTSP